MEKKNNTFIYVGLGLIIFLLLLLLIIWIISKSKGTYTTYEKVIEKMEKATVEYYKTNQRPIDNGEFYLSYDVLVDGGYIKPLNKLLKNGDECNAHMIVINKDSNYSYTPYLNCTGNNGYETIELYKRLIDSANIVTNGSGLYKANDGSYYYRGEVTNNYIKLGTIKREDKELDNIWRILSIESDGTIKIRNTRSTNSSYVWDDRFNESAGFNYGYNDFEKSRLKDTLIFLSNRDSVMTEKYRTKLVPKKLCIGKRSDEDTFKNGSIECALMSNDTYDVGVIATYEFMRISLDDNCNRTISQSCANYNFLSGSGHNNEWLLTANKDDDKNSYMFNGTVLQTSKNNNAKYLYLTAYLTNKSFYLKGSGTLNDPYEIR